MPPKQEQKQKQTVIVNIGDKVVKRKRKRKTKPKKKPTVQSIAYQEAVQGGLPPFIRTQMPTASNVQTDKVLFQLADVTSQLNQLQERQKHATGNLMAGQAAIAREEGAQGSVVQPAAPELKPPPPPAVAKPKRRTAKEMTEAHSMLAEDKPKRGYVKRQTKAEQAATALMQQSEVVGGGRPTSLSDFDGGSGMSSVTMSPALMSPKPQKVGKKLTIVPELQASTPSTVSLAGGSAAEASEATRPNF